jgi:hypothetical protein
LTAETSADVDVGHAERDDERADGGDQAGPQEAG